MTQSVSMRELNQRSGQIIREIVSSHGLVEITERNKPVARLIAINRSESPVEKLIAAGILKAPPQKFSLPEGIDYFPNDVDFNDLLDREDHV